jgi:hypothetical protein
MNFTLPEIFLFANIFLVGVVAAIAGQHAYAHFKPRPPVVKEPPLPPPQTVHLPPEIRERLVHAAQVSFEAVVQRSAVELDDKLNATSIQLDKQLRRVGDEIINDEMQRYKQRLDELRNWTQNSMSGAEKEMAQHQADLKAKLAARQAELEAKLNEDIAAEKQLLVEQLDTKVGDAVTSFLIETLQHNVDLGAQTPYLTAMLEEHKAELVKEVKDEL